jgi:hypothetical protein
LLLGSGAIVGCDRTVEEKKTTEVNRDGSTETKHEKTTVDDDGTVKKETERTETPPTRD